MTLLSLILVLVLVGVILWLINTFVTMDQKVKQVLNIIVVLVVVIWVLSKTPLGAIRV